jgi:DNA polymerase III subunit delta
LGVLREEDFDGFVKRRLSAMNGILIHGADLSAVAGLARQIVKQLGAEPQRIDISAAKVAPGSFHDALLSLSLLGDRQVLIIDPADDSCLKFLEPSLSFDRPANFAILQADSLSKTSKLRVACEASSLFTSLALYEEDQGRLRARIEKFLTSQNLRWGQEAEEAFYASVGVDRSIVMQEAEKLALYCHGQTEVALEDVVASCGDTAEFDVDQLIDAVFGGDLETTDRIMTSMANDTRSFFVLLQLHISKLQALRVDMERGQTLDMAIKNAKPPIFFKRKPAIQNQLRKLELIDLIDIQETIGNVIFQSRKNAGLADALNNRALLSLARLARSRM